MVQDLQAHENAGKNLLYIAQLNKAQDSGVLKKIIGTVDAARKIGLMADAEIVEDISYTGWIAVFKLIVNAKVDIIILRSCGIFMFFLIPALFWVRLFSSTKIIIDVPTPIQIFVLESRTRKRAYYKIFFFELLIRLAFPVSLWFAHKVVQYGEESKYFSLGLKRKMVTLSNGVDVEKVVKRSHVPDVENGLVLIAVANVAIWHGYDRVIRGLANYKRNNANSKMLVRFQIIGEGGAIAGLMALAKALNIEELVEFKGARTGKELYDCYNSAHLAVASLALHRKNIYMASELKAREYTAVGIPFIMTAIDSDFKNNVEFVYMERSEDAPIDIDSLVNWYVALEFCDKNIASMRNYAINNLDYLAKISKILSFN